MRSLLAALAALFLAAPAATAADWSATLAEARGQTVYFHAWGGSQPINDYIAWVGDELLAQYGVTLVQVKLSDTADAVAQVLAEKAAGRDTDGSVDLLWINGENFAALRRADLLHGPFVARLPNAALIDVEGKPTTVIDFTLPTEGYESPWGMAQFVFLYDSAEVSATPRSMAELLAWAAANPGRFTYPQPPDFLGSTFLKQALYELVADPDRLLAPASEAEVAAATAPLWDFLDRLHPSLWRKGEVFPGSGPELLQLLADGEVAIALSFDPYEAAAGIESGLLPQSVRLFTFPSGTIANTHFVAIPYNAPARAGALVAADFLLSPAAQARKQDPAVWGSQTVLDLGRLTPEERALFDALPRHPALPAADALGPALPEPHPTWMEAVESLWLQRYQGG
jgi:putative thiamine transport system substrate-binding protein